MVLTRDRKVLGKPGSALCYFVVSSNARDGFQEVVDHFGLAFTPKAFMARCSNCNASCYKRLEQQEVDKLTAEGALPILTGSSVTKFYMCMGCRKVSLYIHACMHACIHTCIQAHHILLRICIMRAGVLEGPQVRERARANREEHGPRNGAGA